MELTEKTTILLSPDLHTRLTRTAKEGGLRILTRRRRRPSSNGSPEARSRPAEVTDQARAIMDGHPRLMARDVLHAAVCRTAGAEAICGYNADLDAIAGLRRLEPPAVR